MNVSRFSPGLQQNLADSLAVSIHGFLDGIRIFPDPMLGRERMRNLSNFVNHLDPLSCRPGKKAGAEAKKGREKPFQTFSV